MTVVDYGVDVQRRAYRALNEDGIVDMALGLALLFVALYVGPRHLVRWNMTVWTALAPMLVMLAARGLRRRFVYPRIGYARIRPAGPSSRRAPGFSWRPGRGGGASGDRSARTARRNC